MLERVHTFPVGPGQFVQLAKVEPESGIAVMEIVELLR
jgi:hypothetical protein